MVFKGGTETSVTVGLIFPTFSLTSQQILTPFSLEHEALRSQQNFTEGLRSVTLALDAGLIPQLTVFQLYDLGYVTYSLCA